MRIGCEACHGPSGSGGHKSGGTTINPAKLTQDQQIDICGRCHGLWYSIVPGTFARHDIPDFVPGQSLVELVKPENNQGVDRLKRPTWGTDQPLSKNTHFYGNGAINDPFGRMNWYEFKISAHYTKTDSIICSTCHDLHDNKPGRPFGRMLKGEFNTTTGVATVCNDCHKNANFVTKKGKPGAINPHTAKPYGQGVPKEEWRADGKWPWEK
ncbi:MAG: hypothetical protein M0Z31_05975 [Clostridia bacterium]|nr:hypothetical protein [Clostridia bacterium]